MALNTPGAEVSSIGVPGDRGNPVCTLIRSKTEGKRRCEACDRGEQEAYSIYEKANAKKKG